MIESNQSSTSTAPPKRAPKDAYEWDGIPEELMHLAPSKESVVRGSKLDDHLKKLFMTHKKELSCTMLSNSTKWECKMKNKLGAKGYGGKEGSMIFQARCSACSGNYSWAHRRHVGKPSLAQLVYTQSKKTEAYQEERLALKERRLKPKEGIQVIESELASTIKEKSVVKRKADDISLSPGKENQNNQSTLNLKRKDSQPSLAEVEEMLDHPDSWANQPVGSKCNSIIMDDLYSDEEEQQRVIPENWEDDIDVADSNKAILVETAVLKPVVGLEDAIAVMKAKVPIDGGMVDAHIMFDLLSLLSAMKLEIDSLKAHKEKCDCLKDANSENKSHTRYPAEKRSFATVAKSGLKQKNEDMRFSGEKWTKAVSDKVSKIQDKFDMPDINAATTVAASVLKLEGGPRRKVEELTSLYMTGIRKTRYGELRKNFLEIGFKKSSILNMVWRGQVLHIIVLKKSVANITQSIAAVSSKIKIHQSMKWENWFQAESKNKSNVEIKKMLSYSSENLIDSSYQYVKHAARKSAEEGMKAFEQWCRSTSSGKVDDSFTIVKRKKQMKHNKAPEVQEIEPIATENQSDVPLSIVVAEAEQPTETPVVEMNIDKIPEENIKETTPMDTDNTVTLTYLNTNNTLEGSSPERAGEQ